jgi:hypothetical protein
MVGKEQECCGFLSFDVAETDGDIRVTITAPERARDVADTLFEPFAPTDIAATRERTSSVARARDARPMKAGGRRVGAWAVTRCHLGA